LDIVFGDSSFGNGSKDGDKNMGTELRIFYIVISADSPRPIGTIEEFSSIVLISADSPHHHRDDRGVLFKVKRPIPAFSRSNED
jgi:hypothetical protein